MGGGRELGHVEPDLGDDDLGGAGPDAGHLIETVDGWRWAGCDLSGLGIGGPLMSGQLFDELVHAGRDPVELLAESVDLVEQNPGKLAVMGVEPASQCLA